MAQILNQMVWNNILNAAKSAAWQEIDGGLMYETSI